MQLNWKILLVALLFAVAINFIGYLLVAVFSRAAVPDAQAILSRGIVTDVVSFLISPLLLFAVFYFIGMKTDLVSEFRSVVISLFFGSLAGHLIGFGSLILYSIAVGNDNPYTWEGFVLINVFWTFWGPFKNAVSEFFVGFAALAIAFIIKRHSPKTETLSSES